MIELVLGCGNDTYTIPFSMLEDKTMTEEEFLECLIEDLGNEKNSDTNFVDTVNKLPSCVCEPKN